MKIVNFNFQEEIFFYGGQGKYGICGLPYMPYTVQDCFSVTASSLYFQLLLTLYTPASCLLIYGL